MAVGRYKNGRLKKGYRYSKGGRLVKAKTSTTRKRRRKAPARRRIAGFL